MNVQTNSLDKYFTKKNIAELCCKKITQNINIDYNNDLIIEPSAGNGSFLKPITKLCKNTIFIDIKPDNVQIKKLDYLKINSEIIPRQKGKIHIIGNPPFGFKGSLAIKFIKKSCEFCDTFSFILPKSFAKESLKKSVPSYFHLISSYVLPFNSFQYLNIDYDVPSILQIWEKRKYKRRKTKKINPIGYTFVESAKEANIAVRRVGSLAGKILYTNIDLLNKNSHYFIKLYSKKVINKLKDIKMRSTGYVTGPRSISKNDITKVLNKLLS